MAETTRCPCSFEHPPHDNCDGNPGAKFGVSMVGKGLNNIQIANGQMYDRLQPILEEAQTLYNQWEDKNRFSSVHRHYDILDPIVAYGELGLRALFCMMRGGKAGWIFTPIDKIIKDMGLPPIIIEEGDRGRFARITEKFLAWADQHFPPTVLELYWSACFAEEKANEFWASVVHPSLETNYGGTYFTGSLGQAVDYNQMAQRLKQRVKDALESQKEQWKHE